MDKLTYRALRVPLLHINEVTIFAARDYSRKLRKEKFDMEVYLPKYGRNLQRELCWTVDDKEALIRSMLYGNVIAPISAVIAYRDDKDTNGYYQIIDGKQRLTAIFDFIENAYPVVIDDKLYYYDDFDYRLQQALLKNAPIINLCTDEMSDDDKIAWYLRLNYAGVPQQTEYLDKLQELLHPSVQVLNIQVSDAEVDGIKCYALSYLDKLILHVYDRVHADIIKQDLQKASIAELRRIIAGHQKHPGIVVAIRQICKDGKCACLRYRTTTSIIKEKGIDACIAFGNEVLNDD